VITQQYLFDPMTAEHRAQLEKSIAMLEGSRDSAAQAVLASLRQELEANSPRLVPYDPRIHP